MSALPLLIDAFPTPPSHIPPSPGASFNPPPSRPPPGPLPPVPGPSRISEADTLQILLLSSRGNRSRPSSKYSVASSDANRDSVISTNSYHGPAYSPRPSPRLPSSASNRSSRVSSSSIPTSPRSFSRPSIAFSADGAHDAFSPPSMPRDVVSPVMPLFDEDEGLTQQSPRRRARRHQANESISSINMRDIFGATSGGEDDEELLASKPTVLASSHSHKSSLAYLRSEEPAIPSSLSMASSSTTTLRSPHSRERLPEKVSRPPPPSPTPVVRAPSPDIDTIIQSTPRPSKLSAARSFSMSHAERNKTSTVRNVKSMRSIRAPVDEFGAMPNGVRLSKTTVGRKTSTPFDPDDSLNYVVAGVWNHSQADEEEEKRLRELEKELDGSDSDDSSLDLHTPLPHLMVRHGLLSPESKLFPGSESRSNTPYAGVDGRPGSTMSSFSTVSKSGVMKDERDTPTRRVRHRDGRLLRGGIGLTTGLGWSDSEDEDAPSPLTKRLSTLNLSFRSSVSSTSASVQRPHPLSRSYSSGTLYDTYLDEDAEDDEFRTANDWALRQHKSPTSNPPTSWSRKMSTTSASTRTSIASSGGRSSISGGRLSTVSTGSAFSLEVSIPEDYESSLATRRPRTRGSASSGESGLNRRSGDGTPSSGSTLSIPMPVTPRHDYDVPSHVLSTPDPSNTQRRAYLNKDKSLPPLPGGLKKMPSKSNIARSTTPSKQSFPRARTFSSTSSSASSPSAAVPPSIPAHVRPLQLPKQMRATSSGDRPAVPVPSIMSRSMRKASLPSETLITSPTIPSRSLSTSDKPRPRTGTGMLYKKSSSSSKLRPPMPLQSTSLSTSSIGRRGVLPRPTAI